MKKKLDVAFAGSNDFSNYHGTRCLVEKTLNEFCESFPCDLSKLKRIILSADFHKDLKEICDEYSYSTEPNSEGLAVLRKLSDDGLIDETTLLLNIETIASLEPEKVRIYLMCVMFLCYMEGLLKYPFGVCENGNFFNLVNGSFLCFLSSSKLSSPFHGVDKSFHLSKEVDFFISIIKECRIKLMISASAQKCLMWSHQNHCILKEVMFLNRNKPEIYLTLSVFSSIYGYYSSGLLDDDCFLKLKNFLQEENLFDEFNDIGLANIELKKTFDKNEGFDDHEVFSELNIAIINACYALGLKYA